MIFNVLHSLPMGGHLALALLQLPLDGQPDEVGALLALFKHGVDPLVNPLWQSYHSRLHNRGYSPEDYAQAVLDGHEPLNIHEQTMVDRT